MDVYNQVVLGSSYHLYKSNIGLRPQTTTRMSGNSRSDVVLVLYKHHLEVPIQKKIIPMLSCPIELFFIICRSHGGSGSVISLVIIAVIIYLAYILYTKCIAPRFKRTTTNIPPPPYTHNTGGWGSGGGGGSWFSGWGNSAPSGGGSSWLFSGSNDLSTHNSAGKNLRALFGM